MVISDWEKYSNEETRGWWWGVQFKGVRSGIFLLRRWHAKVVGCMPLLIIKRILFHTKEKQMHSLWFWLWLIWPKQHQGCQCGRNSETLRMEKQREGKWYNTLCCCLVIKSYPTLWQPHVAGQAPLAMDFPGRNTGVGCHFSFRASFWPRDETHVSCIGRILYHWAAREARNTLDYRWL